MAVMQEALHTHPDELAKRVRALEAAGGTGGERTGRVATGWREVDASLGGGLLTGAVHEWVGQETDELAGRGRNRAIQHPLGLLMHLMRQAMSVGNGWGMWVGRGCLAYPHGLVNEQQVLSRLLWVEPADVAGRLWAIDLAARCEGMAVVVADGTGLDMAGTRRLQLAAEAGGTLLLLARPWPERQVLSAATTRWVVRPAVSPTDWARWEIELWRCKGSQRGNGTEGRHAWIVEARHERGQGLVVAPAAPADRSTAAQAEISSAHRQRA